MNNWIHGVTAVALLASIVLGITEAIIPCAASLAASLAVAVLSRK